MTKFHELSCGCEIRVGQHADYVRQCPLHTAAPDLLAACESFMAWTHEPDWAVDAPTIEGIAAAVAKARGEAVPS